MTNVITFPKMPMTPNHPDTDQDHRAPEQRLPHSFNFYASGDNMLIDACVPFGLGVKIAQLITEYVPATEDEPKSAPRVSKKRAARR
jgi:hypothetical protein